MKINLDIEPFQANQPEWTKLLGIDLVPPSVAAPHPGKLNFLPLRNTKNASLRKMSCEPSTFDGTFNRIVVIGILLFSDGMLPQEGVAWNGNTDLEMLLQF